LRSVPAIGELVSLKNAAYGDSITKCGAYLRLLFPDGISPEHYDDVGLLTRDFDKSMRIATDGDALGESPYEDKAGYAILGVHMNHQKRENRSSWQGSANAPAVPTSSQEQPGFAKPTQERISGTITTSESALIEPEPSPQPRNFYAQSGHANASSVTEAASASEDVRKSEVVAMSITTHQLKRLQVLYGQYARPLT